MTGTCAVILLIGILIHCGPAFWPYFERLSNIQPQFSPLHLSCTDSSCYIRLHDVFKTVFPVEDYTERATVEYLSYAALYILHFFRYRHIHVLNFMKTLEISETQKFWSIEKIFFEKVFFRSFFYFRKLRKCSYLASCRTLSNSSWSLRTSHLKF